MGNEEDSNTAANNNMTATSSPSPYALDLREALESGLMTEEEYAEAVQEAQRYDSKSSEKKREIADYNEALRIIFADASLKLSDKEQCIVKRESPTSSRYSLFTMHCSLSLSLRDA